MKVKLIILFGILLMQFFVMPVVSKAQSQNSGSASAKAKAIKDSISNAIQQKRSEDSIKRVAAKQALQAYRDSMLTAQKSKRAADSLIRIERKKQLEEKKTLNTQLAKQRAAKLDSTLNVRKLRADSLEKARTKLAKQRKAKEKYKSSRRYRDSVATVKKVRADSLASIRKVEQDKRVVKNNSIRDSLISARNKYNDSLKLVRTRVNDSTKAAVKHMIDKQKAIRQAFSDSMAAVRKQRTDSLAAVRKNRTDKVVESSKKKEEKKKALAIKMLHDKKQKEWTNEKFLKRGWNIPRRIFQNTVTRYNYYYNARRKFNDAIARLKKDHKDDYSALVSLYPFDVRKSGSSVAGDMDSVIKKSSFSTQIHDPRSKWFDDLYFMMGKASYIKNDFDGALTTFQFVANEYKDLGKPKSKGGSSKKPPVSAEAGQGMSIASPENRKGIRKLRHHPVRNQALVWLAKSYMQAEQYSEAMSLITILEKDKQFPKRLKADLYLAKADLEIEQKNYPEAIAALEEVVKRKMPSLQKARAEFVIGQLYEQQHDYARSSAHFKKSISGKSNPEMDFYTKLFIAQNAAKGGGDRAYAVNQLEKIIRDPKYDKYRSEAYNVLAGIFASDQPDKAIDILLKSLAVSDGKNPLLKAKTFASLGLLYYTKGDYEQAKVAYDSASHFGSNPALDNLAEVNTRKDVLTDVVKNIRIIRRQDSLLELSTKSEKEQKAIARKEAERLKKLEDSKKSDDNGTVVALAPGVVIKSNWYFYNNSMLEKGAIDFRQTWGARKLEDNWRRRSAGSNMVAAGGEEGSEEEGEERKLINGSQYETLLADIPKTPAQKDKANDEIMHAFYDLGLIYYAQLQDYPNSIKSFDTLLKRYPKTSYKKQSYYTLYLDHTVLKQETEAARYKKLLQDEFGESEFAKLASNPNYLNEMNEKALLVDRYYDTTYLAYKDEQYSTALKRIAYASETFKGKPLIVKFDLLEAVCLAGIKNFPLCKTKLEYVISTYPGTPEQTKAQDLLNYLNTSGAIAGDTTGGAAKKAAESELPELKESTAKGSYAYDPKVEHLLMIYLNKVDGRTMALKAGLSDFNQFKHETEELATGQNLFTVQQGVVTVSKFSNAVFANIYMKDVLKEEKLFNQFQKGDYDVCLISSQNFNELIKSRDIKGYLEFYKKNYK